MSSRFDQWYYIGDKCDVREWKNTNPNQYYRIQEAWDYQQKEINRLSEELFTHKCMSDAESDRDSQTIKELKEAIEAELKRCGGTIPILNDVLARCGK